MEKTELEKKELFDIFSGNIEWFKQNFERIKEEYDSRWIIILNKQVVASASSFNEIILSAKKHDPNKILVDYVQRKPVAMFF